MRWAGHVARVGDRIYAYRGLVRKPEGKVAFGRTSLPVDVGILLK